VKHRPSFLPALKQCPRFEGDSEERDFTAAGTLRHAALAFMLTGKALPPTLPALSDEDIDAVQWACDYIKLNAPTGEEMIVEQKRTWSGAGFRDREGTPDVTCLDQLFDLKWRVRDCEAQMADYALAMFEEDISLTVVHVHVLFAESRFVQKYQFTLADAERIAGEILDKADDETLPPAACDYCGWCAKRLTCSAIMGQAVKVAHGYSDDPAIKSWHPSKMETAEELAFALKVWRECLKKWGDSIEHHAFVAATKRGMTLPGFQLKTESGGSYIADVGAAFAALGIPQDEFLKACEPRINTSKKYPDRMGLVDIYKTLHGIPKTAAAKRAVEQKLAGVMKDKAPKIYLKAAKSDITETENQ
jgi:hypothetical protein